FRGKDDLLPLVRARTEAFQDRPQGLDGAVVPGLARGDARGMMPFRGEPRDPCPIGTALERMMHRSAPLLLGLGCTLALVLSCFHAVLFQGEQFAYRDAGHFYYPLYRVVQQEWAAGRWPLWNPWQNGGAPLLGMPMAAVLYPGKLIYALLPYA